MEPKAEIGLTSSTCSKNVDRKTAQLKYEARLETPGKLD